MQTVRMNFSLVGKVNEIERGLPKDQIINITNEDRLDFVHDVVANQFGDRAIVVINSDKICKNFYVYPKFYAAGWFIDTDNSSEVVVINHGNTMEEARQAMMESVKSLDWENLSAKIG